MSWWQNTENFDFMWHHMDLCTFERMLFCSILSNGVSFKLTSVPSIKNEILQKKFNGENEFKINTSEIDNY